ncbi:MAG TPA: MaoC family dehydratase [Acidimicrobiales bacterium]|jgi:acyl dehydratase|nr:MaoC family dehydratase [Acidimicrobiales bacterium]
MTPLAERPVSGRWFEELPVGLVVDHVMRRTVTEADNTLFSCLTMNPQPLHLDFDFAASTQFGKPLVNSLFTLGLLVGLTVPELTLGTTVANLGFAAVSFPAPVFAGDTIRAQSTVARARLSGSRPEAGIVEFEHRGVNQHGTLVCTAVRSALMHRRSHSAPEGPR